MIHTYFPDQSEYENGGKKKTRKILKNCEVKNKTKKLFNKMWKYKNIYQSLETKMK